ncbi:thioredoxin 1 [Pelomyxa schiedti]|nr:thioredoxin 1 [Pelomyxa schiedti]
MACKIQQATSRSEVADLITRPVLTIVEFFVPWCHACLGIAQFFDQLAMDNPLVKFVSVDVARYKEIGLAYSITAYPTFKFYKRGSLLDTLEGASEKLLESKTRLYSSI